MSPDERNKKWEEFLAMADSNPEFKEHVINYFMSSGDELSMDDLGSFYGAGQGGGSGADPQGNVHHGPTPDPDNENKGNYNQNNKFGLSHNPHNLHGK